MLKHNLIKESVKVAGESESEVMELLVNGNIGNI
jgi:hypothetical protein